MTTIAACGHWIAADSLLTNNGSREVLNAQKIRVVNGSIYALVGTTCLFEPLIQWHQAEHVPADVPKATDLDWGLMVITKDSEGLFYTNRSAYPERYSYPWTKGTGNEYAMGALKAGASAQRAVEIACEIDIHSGGEIQVVNIAEALRMGPQLVKTA